MKRLLNIKWYSRLIAPKSQHVDDQRRELVFNVLVSLFSLAAAFTLVSSMLNHLTGHARGQGDSLPITAFFLALVSLLWWLSKRGHYRWGVYVLEALLWFAALSLMLTWSIELPMAQTLNILVIVSTGVLLRSRISLILSIVMVATVLLLGYLQAAQILMPNTAWLTTSLDFSDAVGHAVVLAIIGMVSWISNLQIDSLLERSWASEAALQKERDQLEQTVARRTAQLTRAQYEHNLELQRLAEFGRVSASLLHDVASPLTTASLNLEQAGIKDHSGLIGKALLSLQHLENYIHSARKQLQGSSEHQIFDVLEQLNEVADLLTNQIHEAGVVLGIEVPFGILLYGDPVKFHQLIANALLNSVQAYTGSRATNRPVRITGSIDRSMLELRIIDHGTGIKPQDIDHIFEPFFTTKRHNHQGLGIGLAAVRRYVEDDFKGNIKVASSRSSGTVFTITIPIHAKAVTQHTKQRNRIPKKPTRN